MKNRSPTKILDFNTPFEALLGFKPAINHLIVFGSKAFAHVPKEDRKKLDSNAIKFIFVGYYIEFKAYKLFNPSTRKVFVSIDVIFHEQVDKWNRDKGYEDWHMPLLIEDNNEEIKDNNMQQQQKLESSDASLVSNLSPLRSEQDRFEGSFLPRRSGR